MLRLSSHDRGGAFHVALSGRLDGSPSCDDVGSAVQSALASGHRRFVFDLSELKSISSCGIGCLVRSYVRLQRSGARLTLRAPNRRVLQTLEKTCLVPQVFEVVESPGRAAHGSQHRSVTN